MARYLPTRKVIKAEELADVIMNKHVLRGAGLPQSIASTGPPQDTENGSNDQTGLRPAILQDDVEEYEVEQVLDRRVTRGKVQYQVAWTGYPDAFKEWLHSIALANPPELVAEFHKANPTKPGPEKAALGLPQVGSEPPKSSKRN
ncbi:MAG: hypothetical protein M1816_003611 [Peltula sp. TS41687]|nr:MAG: hypothetical protein M1816_003611 [Peltula sp. TS41687]